MQCLCNLLDTLPINADVFSVTLIILPEGNLIINPDFCFCNKVQYTPADFAKQNKFLFEETL